MDNSVQPLHRQQRGFSLLEILAALAIGMIMMMSLTAMVDTTLQDTKGQQTAQYQAQVTAAALRYLNDNAAVLKSELLTSGGTTVTRDLNALKIAHIPKAFAPTNAYGQTPCMLVRNSPSGQLDALFVTEGGDEIPPKDIGYIAANAGTGGGSIRHFVPTDVATPVIALGAFGAWQLDSAALTQFTTAKCSTVSASPGRMASLLSYGGPNAVNRDVLFRNLAPSGDTTLNQMNVPLGFSGSATKVVGAGCPGPGITLEAVTGNILKCNLSSFQWENSASKFWKDPVASYLALLPLTSIDGEVRMTSDTGRAFMFSSTSGTWLPLALDQNGTLNVPVFGNINVAGGNVAVKGDVTATVNMNANNINATTNVTALQGNVIAQQGDVIAQAGNVSALNNVTALQGNLIAQNGEVRSENGNVVARYALVGDSVSTSTKIAGDLCNYFGPKPGGGTIVYLSAGTVVTDSVGRIMECQPNGGPGSNGKFIYVDGTSTTPP